MLYQWEVWRVSPEDAVRQALARSIRRRRSPRQRPPLRRGPRGGTIAKIAAIDARIEAQTRHWRLERMAVVDASSCGWRCTSSFYRPDTPRTVVIDEAIGWRARSATRTRSRFVNGVLDGIHHAVAAGGTTDAERRQRLYQQRSRTSPRSSGLGVDTTLARSCAPTRSRRWWRPTAGVPPPTRGAPPRDDDRRPDPGGRTFGKANFLVLSDGVSRIQAYIRQDSVPERDFGVFRLLDFRRLRRRARRVFAPKNELTIWGRRTSPSWPKCLRPLPEKWHGLQDVEIRTASATSTSS